MRLFWPAWELGWWKLVCASSTCYMVHGNTESEHFPFMFSINRGPLPWEMGKNCYIQIWDARMVKIFYITFLVRRRFGSAWWPCSLPKFETICASWSYVIVAYSCCMVVLYVWLFFNSGIGAVIWIWWQVQLHRLCQWIAYHYLVLSISSRTRWCSWSSSKAAGSNLQRCYYRCPAIRWALLWLQIKEK